MSDNSKENASTPHPTSKAWKIIPHFRSSDIEDTVSFYTTHLGFEVGGIHHEGTPKPTMCSLAVGDKAAANIYFYLDEEKDSSAKCGIVHLALREPALEELYEMIQKQNARAEASAPGSKGEETRSIKIVYPIGDKPWGYKEFTIEDPDANEITFFRFLEGE